MLSVDLTRVVEPLPAPFSAPLRATLPPTLHLDGRNVPNDSGLGGITGLMATLRVASLPPALESDATVT